VPSSLDTVSKSSMVLAAASSFHQTASRLTSVNDTPLPTAELSTQLIEAAVRAARIEVLQESQSREIAALKQRSAAVLQRWYSVDILQVGESWADLEGRVEAVEQAVRRANSASQHDGGII
jgi:broad specificity phosphatase PhoE